MVQAYMGYNPLDDLKKIAVIARSTGGTILRTPQRLIKTATDTAEGVGKGAQSTAKILPVVLTVLAVGIGGYLVFAGRKGVKLIP